MADEPIPVDDRALEVLLRDRCSGPPEPDDASPWDFALRWPDAVVRGRVWPIVSRLLTDDDATVRARAVELVRTWSDGAALATPRLLEVAEQHVDQFGDQTVDGVTLRHTMAHALANRADEHTGARVAAVLREMATHEPIGGGAASVLGRYEPAFVAERAKQWGDAQADWIEEAARSLALFRRDAVIPFLTELRGLGEATRERVLATVLEYMKRDDATATALARGQGLPPPAKPAPPAEYCRRVIGL